LSSLPRVGFGRSGRSPRNLNKISWGGGRKEGEGEGGGKRKDEEGIGRRKKEEEEGGGGGK
jgi:hypothetical protein